MCIRDRIITILMRKRQVQELKGHKRREDASILGNSLLRADRPAVEANLHAVGAGLNGDDIILDIAYASNDAADGGHNIADLQRVAHLRFRLISLTLRTDEHEVENRNHQDQRKDKSDDRRSSAYLSRSAGS